MAPVFSSEYFLKVLYLKTFSSNHELTPLNGLAHCNRKKNYDIKL